jgi:hypothetical protein
MQALLISAAVFLGAGVLGAALSQHPEWTLPAALGAVAFGLLAVILYYPPVRRRLPPWAQTADDRQARLRTALAEFIASGNGLMARLGPLKDETDLLALIETDASQWATDVRDFLDRDAQGSSALFLDESYGPTQYGSQFARRDNIRNWLQRRLSKLGEIARSLT